MLCEGRVVYYGQPSFCLPYISTFDFLETKSLLGRQTYRREDQKKGHSNGQTKSDDVGSDSIAYNPADLMMELLYSNTPVMIPPRDMDEEHRLFKETDDCEGSEAVYSGNKDEEEDIKVAEQVNASSANLLAVCAPRYSLMYYYNDAWALEEARSCLNEVDVSVGAKGECKEGENEDIEAGDGGCTAATVTHEDALQMHKRKVPFINQVRALCLHLITIANIDLFG